MKPTLVLFLFFLVFSVYAQQTNKDTLSNNVANNNATEQTPPLSKEEQRYLNDEKRLLGYLNEKKYKWLMRLSNEMVHKYHNKGLPEYTYAIGLYALMDNTQFKKTYDKYRLQYWRMIALMLKNSKKHEYDTELVKSSWNLLDEIQSGIFEVAQKHMKIGNDKNSLNYLTLIMQVFDERRGIYKNKFQNLIQDKIFTRAKGHYEEGKMQDADFVFNWLDKFFYKSKFPYKYAGLASFTDKDYQFDEWGHSKYYLANTAAGIKGMSKEEKQIIFLQNLVRMNPTLFKNTFLKKYLEKNPQLTGNTFVASLRTQLDGKTALPLLYVDSKLNESALAFQIATKDNDSEWTSTDTSDANFLQKVTGEGSPELISGNCYHGKSDKPEAIVMELLINNGVTDLLQRNTILNPTYIQVGMTKGEHTHYAANVAFNYSSGDEETRKKVAKEKAARDREASDKIAVDKEAVAKAARDKKAKDNYAKDRAAQEKRFRGNRNKDVHMGYNRRRR
jgi:hypothetical protein